ncbi:MAG: hypothetical protein GX897_04720 [Clostridiales bacterium]|nr:hypothetical protein [Clostridiales bacterium]
MKNRMAAFILVAVTILSLLSMNIFAGAASPGELSYWIDLAIASPTKMITVPNSVSVTADTTIPADITVSMAANTTLTIKEDLTVNGRLNINGFLYITTTGKIDSASTGFITYPYLDYIGTDRAGIVPQYITPPPYYAQYPFYGLYYYGPDGTQYDYHSYEYIVDGVRYEASIPWWFYYGPTYPQALVPTYTYSSYFCPVHSKQYVYCPVCSVYYCPDCTSHVHSFTSAYPTEYYYGMTYAEYLKYVYNYYLYPSSWNFSDYNEYIAYLNSVYYRDFYAKYVYNHYRCRPGIASIPSGVVEVGTRVALSTQTTGGTIYYTLDGSTPNAGGYRYTGPITITKNTTLKTVVLYSNYIASEVMTYRYVVSPVTNFSDIRGYDGLGMSLSKLVAAGVIQNSTSFDPKGTFTYDELIAALAAIGCDIEKANIENADALRAEDALTYNDFVYVTYKILRANNKIRSPQSAGSYTIRQIRNYKNIKDAAIYRAAFISFVENGLFYDLEFDPAAAAPRYEFATVIANLIK